MKNAAAIILLYSVGSQASFDALKDLHSSAVGAGLPGSAVAVVVGLFESNSSPHVVSVDSAADFADGLTGVTAAEQMTLTQDDGPETPFKQAVRLITRSSRSRATSSSSTASRPAPSIPVVPPQPTSSSSPPPPSDNPDDATRDASLIPDIPEYKIMLLGDSGVGKTSLIDRFTSGVFTPGRRATSLNDLSAAPKRKLTIFEDDVYRARFFDSMSGPEAAAHDAQAAALTDADAFILVFSLANQASLDYLKTVAALLKNRPVVLVGNKSDYEDPPLSRSDARMMAMESLDSCPVITTSLKTGENVDTVLDKLYKVIRSKGAVKEDGHSLSQHPEAVQAMIRESTTSSVVREGWLMKKGRKDAWDKRYVRLDGNMLRYFLDDTPKAPLKGQLTINEHVTIARPSDPSLKGENGYEFSVRAHTRSLSFASESPEDRDTWEYSILLCVQAAASAAGAAPPHSSPLEPGEIVPESSGKEPGSGKKSAASATRKRTGSKAGRKRTSSKVKDPSKKEGKSKAKTKTTSQKRTSAAKAAAAAQAAGGAGGADVNALAAAAAVAVAAKAAEPAPEPAPAPPAVAVTPASPPPPKPGPPAQPELVEAPKPPAPEKPKEEPAKPPAPEKPKEEPKPAAPEKPKEVPKIAPEKAPAAVSAANYSSTSSSNSAAKPAPMAPPAAAKSADPKSRPLPAPKGPPAVKPLTGTTPKAAKSPPGAVAAAAAASGAKKAPVVPPKKAAPSTAPVGNMRDTVGFRRPGGATPASDEPPPSLLRGTAVEVAPLRVRPRTSFDWAKHPDGRPSQDGSRAKSKVSFDLNRPLPK